MNKFSKIISLLLAIVIATPFIGGCAKNNLLSITLNKMKQSDDVENETPEEIEADEDTSEEDDENRLESLREEIATFLIDSDKARLDSLSLEELEAIHKTKENLITNLRREFLLNGVDVTVDAKSGAVSFRPSALFVKEESEISSGGEKRLTLFLPLYTFIIYNSRYGEMVSEIVLEYHGGSEDSESFLRNRMNTLTEYCSSNKSGMSTTDSQKFNAMLKTNTYLYDGVEENEPGEILFKFMIGLE